MNNYKGLWNKEMKMMKGFQLVVIIVMLGMIFWSLFLNNDSDNFQNFWEVIAILNLGLVLMPATLLFSLNMEVHQLSLLLYNRNAIFRTIQVKFLHSIWVTLVFFGWMTIFLFVLKWINYLEVTSNTLISILFVLFHYTFMIGLWLNVIVYAAWVIHRMLITRVGFPISILCLVGLAILFSKLFSWSEPLINWIGSLWTISFSYFEDLALDLIFITQYNQISLSLFIFTVGILWLLYYLFTLLLEKKVEV